MGDKSKIEWTDATWNPTYGCVRVSPGCENCYAERFVHRFSGPGQRHDGLTVIRGGRPGWSGKIQLAPERLGQVLRWKRPRMVFVNSMSDLFHEKIPFEYVAACFGAMAATPRHTYQVLTKRPGRALEFFLWLKERDTFVELAEQFSIHIGNGGWDTLCHLESDEWPLPNVWLGVSVEDQLWADRRIPLLRSCPAAVRFLSCEPLLGPLDLAEYLPSLGWVIVGAESGPGARPMDEEWVRLLKGQCVRGGVPFFFKQGAKGGHKITTPELDGQIWTQMPEKAPPPGATERVLDLLRGGPDV
jgi:protein gp37